MTDDVLDQIRGLSEEVIRKAVPAEAEVFEPVWSGCEQWVRRACAVARQEWSFGAYETGLRDALAATGAAETVDLQTPRVIGVIAAVWLHLATLDDPGAADTKQLTGLYGGKLRVHDETVQELIGDLMGIEAQRMRERLVKAEHVARGADWPTFEAITVAGTEPVAEADLEGLRERARSRHQVLIDRTEEKVFVVSDVVDLGPTLTRCLEYLILRRNRICRYDELFETHSAPVRAGREEASSQDKVESAVRQWVSRIRKATGWRPGYPIKNFERTGYRWVGTQSFCVLRQAEREENEG